MVVKDQTVALVDTAETNLSLEDPGDLSSVTVVKQGSVSTLVNKVCTAQAYDKYQYTIYLTQ